LLVHNYILYIYYFVSVYILLKNSKLLMGKGKDRYYSAEGGFEESSVDMRGTHGDYTIDRESLA